MHALRREVLVKAVDALIGGRRLTLIDVARSWPGATRVRAPLKALDRLLSNTHLHTEREQIYAKLGSECTFSLSLRNTSVAMLESRL